jgi:hypothetical protein
MNLENNLHDFLDINNVKDQELLSLMDLHFCKSIQNKLEPKLEKRRISPLPSNLKGQASMVAEPNNKPKKRLTISNPLALLDYKAGGSGSDQMTNAIFDHIRQNREKRKSIVNIPDWPEKENKYDKTQVTVFCKTHKWDWNTYCRDCKLLICEDWLQSDDIHSDHKLESVKVTIDKISKNMKKSLNNVQKILTHSLSSEISDDNLNIKLEEVFKTIHKEKQTQIERVDEKFKGFLSAVKQKYKTIKKEIDEIYTKTEEDIKATYKGLTSLVNIVGRSTRQINSFLATDHRY